MIKRKVFTQSQLESLNIKSYQVVKKCFQLKTLRLLGIMWKKQFTIKFDFKTGDIIVDYE